MRRSAHAHATSVRTSICRSGRPSLPGSRKIVAALSRPIAPRRRAWRPGRQSGSSRPASAFAARARMKSRSETPVQVDERERIHVCAPRGSAASSARRQTARATWRRAAASVPPGQDEALQLGQRLRCARRRAARGRRSSPASTRRRSSGPRTERRDRRRRRTARSGRASSGARSVVRQVARRARRRAASSARRRCRTRAMRGSSFDAREPSPRLVSPASPPRV